MSNIFCGEVERIDSLTEPLSINEPQGYDNKSERKSNDIRLQDIEEQLEMAETRCNSLKDQLDYMKQMYGANRNPPIKCMKKMRSAGNSAVAVDGCVMNNDDNNNMQITNALLNRQKSNHIGTDNTGAAVRTINNILNGITNSVNRLSEIHSQLTTPRVKVATVVSPRHATEIIEESSEFKQIPIGVIPELKVESTSTLHPKSRGQKRKASNNNNNMKPVKATSQHVIKKPLKTEKKTKNALVKSSAILDKKSSTIIKHRFLSKFNSKNNNLVEIYHNDAVKHSDSDESNMKKSRQQNDRSDHSTSKLVEEIPPLNMHLLNPKDALAKSDLVYPNGYGNSFGFEPPQAPRTTVSCCYSKNYELPTVASKMKQVAKSYMGSLNLKTIPFCAAISTTQSHNIGINIQQVMNIIKNRQPINGISPTLAHNIGLAAEKMNNKPFATLVSTINSRMSQAVTKCPLSRTYLNVQQLQEQAKNIPEETIEEGDEDAPDSPETHTMIITGPSGDMEIKTKKVPTWRADQSNSGEQCTCVTQPNVAFQHIANKYQRNIRTITENSFNSQVMDNQIKKRLRKHKSIKNNLAVQQELAQENHVQTVATINQDNGCKEDPLHGREKDLKEVLTSLHRDFDTLNKKYEDLSQQSQSENENEGALKELERLESELSKKEEEITMVMTLCKEVLALKQQVRQLREKRSQASLPSNDAKQKFKEYNNPEAAFHLTKLLKQIQHYQMRYKSNLSQE